MTTNFNNYNLKDYTNKFIELNYFQEPTKIQEKVIPLALKQKDVIGVSQTGTGKTHAFLIPILNQIDVEKDQVQAIITAPTRELALQIYTKALDMQKALGKLRIKLITGGIEKTKMSSQLKRQPHIVIGTPGRMRDLFLDDKSLLLQNAKMLVIDEADMTMEYGFLEDIDQICSRMKKPQMMSFSATIPEQLRLFLKKYMVHPEMVEVKDDKKFKPRIEHILIPCKHFSYEDQLMKLLPTFNPYLCLIFANTRTVCSEVAKRMRDEGYGVIELHGDLTSRERRSAMKDLGNLKEKYIVASDIAARGIDIDGVSHVVSLGFPKELDFYIHRSGRTGRAGNEGICFALYNTGDEGSIKQLQNKGIHFLHQRIVGSDRYDLKPVFYKRKRGEDPLEKEVSKIVNNKKVKVKPGYKKKRKAKVDQLKRKAKRQMVQSEIKKQAKEKAKARQRAKRGEE
ncbi:ATP-dependent RNA helicase CshB [Breznakia sp. PF5-3]|uniref:DEAD/DEAH box helicase n=1 Tax=unclassified Breznakia TaxID=2623764 RepID=UPI002404F380|nr:MULTISPECIES: DEAD/DEAH box helicase [unclassified Breznakia]MDF9825342.1 ATP-dependent RNA helicase CshB [Breznakia sp. PM6-1]MDF9836197.1 ATP-dependent RNA helicase CshB [Breznakia sp. PF5-3]MDF9838405.1 ATP-dependent RNA helicase CshB [Breznakia sp. PFB2-8]MDF9860421.1 ATP-dependent RNA helicase CshB [Breznakia sp. PH5-24]